MREQLQVHVGAAAIRAGTLIFEASGGREHSVFTYDQAWMDHPDAFPLSPSMPFRQVTYFVTRQQGQHSSPFPGPIADTCPDAWGRAIVKRDGTARNRPFNELDYLVAVDDETRLGALRFRGADGAYVRQPEAGRPRVPPLLDLEALMLASDAVEARTETQRDIARLLGAGSSLGGARPKCAVIDEDGRLAIAKFTSRRDELAVERAEVATLRLARHVGINAPDARVIEVAGRAVAVIRRFDRNGAKRVPYVSAQTMLDVGSAEGGTYEDLTVAIRSHGHDPGNDLRELFNRIAFTILVGNTDDHLRNHGFLHVQRGQWELAPVFDVNPSPERHRVLKTRIHDGATDEASLDVLLAAANLFDLGAGDAEQALSTMRRAVAGAWRGFMKEAGMKPHEIAAYEPAFAAAEPVRGPASASRGRSGRRKVPEA